MTSNYKKALNNKKQPQFKRETKKPAFIEELEAKDVKSEAVLNSILNPATASNATNEETPKQSTKVNVNAQTRRNSILIRFTDDELLKLKAECIKRNYKSIPALIYEIVKKEIY